MSWCVGEMTKFNLLGERIQDTLVNMLQGRKWNEYLWRPCLHVAWTNHCNHTDFWQILSGLNSLTFEWRKKEIEKKRKKKQFLLTKRVIWIRHVSFSYIPKGQFCHFNEWGGVKGSFIDCSIMPIFAITVSTSCLFFFESCRRKIVDQS